MPAKDALAPFVSKLARRSDLGPTEEAALLGLPHQIRRVERGSLLTREGERMRHCLILLSGFAFSSKTCASGARAVPALHMKGEPLDITGCSHSRASCDVQALTTVEVAEVSREALAKLAHDYPQIALALWRLTARTASVLGEWLMNVGRRDARGRISHLICEIATRQKALDPHTGAEYHMPLTQEQLGDSTGLTSVHVNRVLQGLRRDKLIGGKNRELHILDWEGLKRAADFQPTYLQLAT